MKKTSPIVGDHTVEMEMLIPAGAIGFEIATGLIDNETIQSLAIHAKSVAMTIFTNAPDGTGGQRFSLAVGKSVVWDKRMTDRNPVMTSIRKFFVNNADVRPGIFVALFLLWGGGEIRPGEGFAMEGDNKIVRRLNVLKRIYPKRKATAQPSGSSLYSKAGHRRP